MINEAVVGKKATDDFQLDPVSVRELIMPTLVQVQGDPHYTSLAHVWYRVIGCLLQIIEKLLELVETLSQWIDETPPIDQPQRFGNKAFTKWWERIRDVC